MWRVIFLLPGLWAGPGLAQEALDAEAFEALTRGKTFYFSAEGAPYGGEQYLGDRRVRWSFLDGKCLEGRWWQEGEMICFVYEDDPDWHCWQFRMEADGLRAQVAGDAGGRVLYELRQSAEPLLCLGPEVGV